MDLCPKLALLHLYVLPMSCLINRVQIERNNHYNNWQSRNENISRYPWKLIERQNHNFISTPSSWFSSEAMTRLFQWNLNNLLRWLPPVLRYSKYLDYDFNFKSVENVRSSSLITYCKSYNAQPEEVQKIVGSNPPISLMQH